MQQSSCCCKKELPLPHPKELKQLEVIFFGTPVNQGIPVNTLTEQILMLNMATVDLRLFMQLVKLRTDPKSQQPMYWAQPMLQQMLRGRLVEIRKLTERHNPKEPLKHTLSFPHLLYELELRNPDQEQSAYLEKIEKSVSAVAKANSYIVNKYVVHAATAESRASKHPDREKVSVKNVWERVLVLNHVFYALFRYVQQERDMSPYPHTVPNHLHDMRRYFLLTEPEYVNLQLLSKESTDSLDAIQSMSVAPPWQPRT